MGSRIGSSINRTSQIVVLLTGAARGIGRATAGALGKRGYALGLIDRELDALTVVADELRTAGVSVEARATDVTDIDGLGEAVHAIEASLGPVDVLVACAGVGWLSSAVDLDVHGLRRMLDVNVVGVAAAIQSVASGMFARGSGHIVGISSVAGYRGMPWMPGYSASKAAVATYLEGLRPAFKRRGVRITTVYPGFVRTGMTLATPFRKPVAMLEPEQAADYLVRAIERKPRDYTIPLTARLGMGLLRRLPNSLFDHCMDQAGPRALTTDF
jgi:short-subunit dehydrogenase